MTIGIGEAIGVVMRAASRLDVADVAIADAVGRVLAEPVRSLTELPPWDNAGMDGYALHGSDVSRASREAPVALEVIETVRAGSFPTLAVARGQATRIMTGAPVPAGADCVIRVEDTDGGVTRVRVHATRDVGRNIRPRGEDLRKGDVVLPAGASLRPWMVGTLAAAGAATVRAHRRPRVAILGGGDELVALDALDRAIAGQAIVASNGYALAALAQAAGAEVVPLGIVPDDVAALAEAFARARECDILLTTGGVSVGAFDYARDAFERVGGRVEFWRVRMRPGSQLTFGTLGTLAWLGLPGNPASALVTFEVFALPMIRAMLGHDRCFRPVRTARLAEPVTTGGGATYLLRATLEAGDGRDIVRLSGRQGSHVQSSIARANALLIVPEDAATLEAGAACLVLPLDGEEWVSAPSWR